MQSRFRRAVRHPAKPPAKPPAKMAPDEPHAHEAAAAEFAGMSTAAFRAQKPTTLFQRRDHARCWTRSGEGRAGPGLGVGGGSWQPFPAAAGMEHVRARRYVQRQALPFLRLAFVHVAVPTLAAERCGLGTPGADFEGKGTRFLENYLSAKTPSKAKRDLRLLILYIYIYIIS